MGLGIDDDSGTEGMLYSLYCIDSIRNVPEQTTKYSSSRRKGRRCIFAAAQCERAISRLCRSICMDGNAAQTGSVVLGETELDILHVKMSA